MLKHTIDGYTIHVFDAKNYTVTHEGAKIGYYGNIASAVKEIARRLANNIEGESLSEWLAEYKRVLVEFSSIVDLIGS
jgi:hypothetical protein